MKTYAPVTEEVIEALKGVVGAEYVLNDAETLEHYQTDEETDCRKFHKPEVVVKPANAEEIAEIMKLANKFDVPVTVRSACRRRYPGLRRHCAFDGTPEQSAGAEH